MDWINRLFVDPELVNYVKAGGREHEKVLRGHGVIDFDKVMWLTLNLTPTLTLTPLPNPNSLTLTLNLTP